MHTLDRGAQRELAAKATKLKPIILIGNKGLTQAVHHEIDRALNDHELIKIRFHSKDRDESKRIADEICQQHQALLIQKIGHVIVIYRKKQED